MSPSIARKVAQHFMPKQRKETDILSPRQQQIVEGLVDGLSYKLIADELHMDEQTVRNYFGAHNYSDGQVVEWHLEPGPGGGIVHLEDTSILDRAIQIIEEGRVALQ